MSDYRLEILDGPKANQEVEIGEVVSIGRMKENDLVFDHPAVSRRHARILRRSTGIYIEDLGSAHGTSVNGERIQSRELRPGDIISVGPISLRLVSEGARFPAANSSDVLLVQSIGAPNAGSIPLKRKTDTSDPRATAARLEALLQVGMVFQGEREIGKLMKRITEVLLNSLDIDRCGIFLSGKADPELVMSRSGQEAATALPFSRTLLRRAEESREALVTSDAGRDARLAGASLAAGTIRSAMVAPLWGRERVMGAVVVENRGRPGAFDAEDLRLLVVLANLAGTAIENAHLIEEVRKETADRAALGRFLSPNVAEKIRAQSLTELFVGERREITVLFTDIRGFTTLTESLPPEEILEAINRVMSIKIDAIFSENGTIDKFTGDGVLALFGAPIAQEDHAVRAIRVAQSILHSCRNMATASGRPLPIGIGIASGQATVGPIGSSRRMEYTAMGDVVNVAARLVAQAGGGEILMTAETAQAAAMRDSSELMGSWQVRGRKEEVQVYRLRG